MKLRRRVANLDPAKRYSAHSLQMNAVAQEVCMAAGSDVILDPDGVKKISKLLHDYFAPDAVGSVYQ